jgi:hypothetical protein
MAGEPVRWSDEVDEVIRGDLTAAAAYITAAGGAVVTGVCPMGIDRREMSTDDLSAAPNGCARHLEVLGRSQRESGLSIPSMPSAVPLWWRAGS